MIKQFVLILKSTKPSENFVPIPLHVFKHRVEKNSLLKISSQIPYNVHITTQVGREQMLTIPDMHTEGSCFKQVYIHREEQQCKQNRS